MIAHKLNAAGPEEYLWLIEHTHADFILELRANTLSYSDWLAGHEADAVWYRYYCLQLQMLSWKWRGIHWVCKALRHLPGLGIRSKSSPMRESCRRIAARRMSFQVYATCARSRAARKRCG